MIRLRTRSMVGAVLALGIVMVLGQGRLDVLAQTSHDVSQAMVEGWMTELSNWGRWGDDDQLGALNLITPDKRKQAAGLVREGISVSMSHNYLTERAADATSPFEHEMTGVGRARAFVGDRYSIAYHGYAHSHMDSLCHMAYEGVMYNGFTRANDVSEAGCGKLAILDAKQGIMTKGVLMDIARLKGVDYLEPGTPIYVEDLEAWERQAGVRVEPGDILLVRAGRWARRAEVGPWATGREAAGLHASVGPWLKARDVAMIGSDYTNVGRGRRLSADPPAGARRDGRADLRQSRPRGGGRGGRSPEPLGVHADRRTACGHRWDRVAPEPDRDVLDTGLS